MVRWSNYDYFFDISRKSNHTNQFKTVKFLIDRGLSRSVEYELTAPAVLNLSTIGRIYGLNRENSRFMTDFTRYARAVRTISLRFVDRARRGACT